MKAMSEIGFITYSMLLEIYNDDEEIPEEIVDLVCYKPKASQHLIIHTNKERLKELNEALDKYINDHDGKLNKETE